MPSRVTGSATREASPPSGSEKSFVSAEETENTSSGESRFPPSTAASSSAVAPNESTPSPRHTKTISDISDLTYKPSVLSPSPPRRSTVPVFLPTGSYFSPQPDTSGNDPRSPQLRRAPASRSSHGIETASGPPPALSTQRSYTGSNWRTPASTNSRPNHPVLKAPLDVNSNIDSVPKPPHTSTNESTGFAHLATAQTAYSRPNTSDGVMTEMQARTYALLESDDDRDTAVPVNGYTQHGKGLQGRKSSQKRLQSSQEDLFLNLARDDSVVEEPSSSNERRRSRVGASSFSQTRPSRPSSSSRPNTSAGSFGGQQTFSSQNQSQKTSFDLHVHRSPENNLNTLASLRDTSSRDRPYAASAHPLDQRFRSRHATTSFENAPRNPSMNEGPPETPKPYARRRSIREQSPENVHRAYRQNNLSHISNGVYGSLPMQSSPAYGQEPHRETYQAAGTESTVSTTAPSTVWDELDNLKSRLRKLELTGILPKSSNAAMSGVLNERPQTATTTMTNMSSSPKRRKAEHSSPEASTIKNPSTTNIHPLLHSALAKAKSVIKPNVFRSLEAAASDALNLAALTGSAGSLGNSPTAASVVGPANAIDRQLRRKADNMCRNLTELCISLTEDMPESENFNPRQESRDTTLTEAALPRPRLLRKASDEPETSASSRVMSRLDARRASLLGSSPLHVRRGSPQESTTPTQTATPVSSGKDRVTSVFSRTKSTVGEDDSSHTRRPLSRANTEIGQMRPSPQSRISREYTSQHPMPNKPQLSPSLQSSLPTRKSYFNSTTPTSSPLTPNVQPGNKRYLDRHTPPSSTDSTRLAEARQRRIASLGQAQSRIGSVSSGRLRLSETEQKH